MKSILAGLFIALSAFTFLPGSGTAVLTCESESGRTRFTAYLQDITGLLERAEFAIDGSTMKFTEDEEVYTVFDPEHGVFTLYLKGKTDKTYQNHKYLQFWAIPATFKTVKNERSHHVYEFKAIIYGTEPRPGKEMHCPEIELNCRLEYSI